MNLYITENQFLAPISQYSAFKRSKGIILETHENYQKRSFRNKCIISGPNKLNSLVVPLTRGKNAQLPIRDVKISYDDDWQRLHLHTFRTNYGSAPYFDYIYAGVESLYQSKHNFLFDFNLEILRWTLQFLDLELEIEFTDNYYPSSHYKDELDGRQSTHPRNYTKLQNNWKPYEQVFGYKHGFTPNLSIIDLIFCCGKESILYLS